jgi:hypothetical protein
MPELIILLVILIIGALCGLLMYLIVKRKVTALVIIFFFISVLLFLGSLGPDYNQVVAHISVGDPDYPYGSLANVHLPSFLTFYVLAITALVVLWLKGRRLPPLLFVILTSLLLIGIVINFVLLIQICWNAEAKEFGWRFMPLPLVFITAAILVPVKVLRAESIEAEQREYQNPTLNRLNKLIAKTAMQPVWVLVLMFPLYVLITLILMLFGQTPDAMVKVFADTTTWLLSQKSHPPYIEPHSGHYLCTIAACGDPAVVKPLIIGKRHGNPIIVNRQLQVANAFEELI